jgi:nucleoside-diphosphate-sugar epimerase
VEVVGIDNERAGDWARLKTPCEQHRRDLTEMTVDDLSAVCDGADALFHLAAEKYNASRSTPERLLDVNVAATDRLFRAAGRTGVGKVVFTSSLYAYGSLGPRPMHEDDVPRPGTRYGASKVAGEHLLRVVSRDHDLPSTIVRLFFVYGPRQHAGGGYKSVIVSNFERILRGERPTVYGDGEQALDYVYVDDAVDALVACADHRVDGELLNVASGHAVSVNELTALMLEVSGSRLQPLGAPADWTAGTCRFGDPQRIAQRLGWKPQVGLEDGLRRVWTWMSARA